MRDCAKCRVLFEFVAAIPDWTMFKFRLDQSNSYSACNQGERLHALSRPFRANGHTRHCQQAGQVGCMLVTVEFDGYLPSNSLRVISCSKFATKPGSPIEVVIPHAMDFEGNFSKRLAHNCAFTVRESKCQMIERRRLHFPQSQQAGFEVVFAIASLSH